jgi:hypothetical protein
MNAEQFAALGLIGKIAIALFMLAWLGAAMSAIPLIPYRAKFNEPGFSVWRDANLRPKFVRFVSFCGAGVAAALIGFTLGGWPMR